MDKNRQSTKGHHPLNQKLFVTIFIVIVLLQLILSIVFGISKKGFHIDEYFSYSLSNSADTLYLPVQTNEWNETSKFMDTFAVMPESANDAFNYARVFESNAKDVHPPLYYILLHTICSMSQGVFSKWQGIGLNIFFMLLCLCLVALITYNITGNQSLVLAVSLIFALNPGTYTSTIFVRMYAMLSMFVLLAVYLHLSAITENGIPFLYFLPCCMLCCFLGFLTQYYFIIFMAFISCAFVIFLLCKRQFKRVVAYIASLLAALYATYLFYPAWVQHIFGGYRGVGAAESFMNWSDGIYKIRAFINDMSVSLFSHCTYVLAGALVLLVITATILYRKQLHCNVLFHGFKNNPAYLKWLFLLFVSVGSFLVIAKISLYEPSKFTVRYILPVYAPVLILTVLLLYWLLKIILQKTTISILLTLVCFISINLVGLTGGKSVIYQFSHDESLIAAAKEHHDTPTIIMCNNALFIAISDQLMQYDRLYIIHEYSLEPIADMALKASTDVLVYMDNQRDFNFYIHYIYENIPGVTHAEKMDSPDYDYTLYHFYA